MEKAYSSLDTKTKLLLTIKETAHALNISEQHIRNCISKGTFPIPVKRIGRAVRCAVRDVESYVDSL